MKLTFLGGADEVGASCTLLEIAGKRILVDCGIRPTPKASAGLAGDQLPNLEQIATAPDAILVTHAHTDHTGALELIAGRFPGVPVYASAPTIALTRVLHQDARRIMQSRLDEEGELPLFDDLAVQQLMSMFVPVPLKTRLALGEGLAVTFFHAGHIAGAAMLGFESDEGNLLMTGDISISPQRTVDGARPPAFRPDVMVVESTYGGRLHANRAVQERKLIETVAEVCAAGGKALIPAFALGRAQEILLILSEFQRRGELPAIPVWADGMVRAVCQAYTSFADALPLALQERGAQFFEGSIRPVQNSAQRNDLLWQPGPAIIVSSSGMLAGGPSMFYARGLAGSSQHAILLTGYQDEESPGRRLQELAEKGRGSIRLGQDKVDVQCRIGTYSLSAHADESQIISLTETLDPAHVLLVHGDGQARASLERGMSERKRIVHLPRSGQTLEFHPPGRKNMFGPAASGDLRAAAAETTRRRQAAMQALQAAPDQFVLLRGSPPLAARCLAVLVDHLWVEIAPGLEQAAFPEDVLSVYTDRDACEAAIPASASQPGTPQVLEPNQALALANRHFPPSARLRKVGYRLDQRVLTLAFDFPDVARTRYISELAALQADTGWQVEVSPEANQIALATLAQEVLPPGWQVTKGPSIHREQKRVALTLNAPAEASGHELAAIYERFLAESGYELSLTLSVVQQPAVILPVAERGQRLEINAAYTLIRTALEGSTLYRTSLKGDEIVLSFISAQVGMRYQDVLDDLSQRCGWPLRINPSPNQGVILEIGRALFLRAGLAIQKGPSIYLDKAEASVTLEVSPDPDVAARLTEVFEERTGFRLRLSVVQPSAPAAPAQPVAEIPLARIRLSAAQRGVALDPLKLEKAVERARRVGIAPPVSLRRAGDGYILVDGLYRLRAAEALNFERIPAVIE